MRMMWKPLAGTGAPPTRGSRLPSSTGDGVPQDDARAGRWFYLALTQNAQTRSREVREKAAAKLTPEQLAATEKLAATCQASGFKDCGEPAP